MAIDLFVVFAVTVVAAAALVVPVVVAVYNDIQEQWTFLNCFPD